MITEITYSEPFYKRSPKNGWTDRDAVWALDSDGAKEACIRWSARWRHLANTTELSMCERDYCEHLLESLSTLWHYLDDRRSFQYETRLRDSSSCLCLVMNEGGNWQEAELSQRDRATLYVSLNLVNCCTTVWRNAFENTCIRWLTDLKGHSRSSEMALFDRPYMTSC